MINGFFVGPDLSHRRVSFGKDNVAQFLHGTSPESIEVVFKEGGTRLSALFSPEARAAVESGTKPCAAETKAMNRILKLKN